MGGPQRAEAAAAPRSPDAHYTPPAIANRMAAWALAPHRSATHRSTAPPRVLDPACGDGRLLEAAWPWLARCLPADAPLAAKLQLARDALLGIDADPDAVSAARRRLARCVAGDQNAAAEQALQGCVRTADALADATWAGVPPSDVVLANPPFLNSRRLSRRLSLEQRRSLRQRFQTARGAFDLYVVFLELAWRRLSPGGRCAVIVPNKLGGLQYAQACRKLLLEQTSLERIVDATDARLFSAGVYPWLLVWQKSPPAAEQAVQIETLDATDKIRPGRAARQAELTEENWSLDPTPPVEQLVATRSLGEIACWRVGTPGFAAAKTASMLCERADCSNPEESRWREFLTSGRIDPYRIEAAGRTRFLKRDWCEPMLDCDSPLLGEARRRMFQAPKLMVAGLSRRLEAAWDATGRAAGVQVYVATDLQVDRHQLLALLNSTFLSWLFRQRHGARQLAGGYLAINKRQLEQLPVPEQDSPRLSELGRAREAATDDAEAAVCDCEIDRLVEQLYGVRQCETQGYVAMAEPPRRPSRT